MLNIVLLVFTVCNTDTCMDRELILSDRELTPMQCMIKAQTELANWSAKNPGWTITKYHCERG